MHSGEQTERKWDLLVRGGQLALSHGLQAGDVACRDGRIVAMGALQDHPLAAEAGRTIEARGRWVLPGIIDTQVHFREPGLEHKEDLGTGSAAAILGGVTSLCEMPNTRPPTTSAGALQDKLARARGRCWTDHAFFVGACAENIDQIAELETLPGCAGIKVFMGSSTGSLLVASDELLREVLRKGQRRVAIHAEDEPRLQLRRDLFSNKPGQVAEHPHWRDAETARLATERILRLSAETGRRIHVLHITTADELPLLQAHRDLATVETTPQHLTLSAPDCYQRLGTLAQMNPPIRSEEHRQALWRALRSGLIDVLGSDHAPHTLEEKAQPWPSSPSGMPGVQTMLPLMLEHLHRGELSLTRLLELLCSGPARIYGMVAKGRLAVGMDADLCLVDPNAQWTIRAEDMASRCGWTPFDGMAIRGRPVMTVLRGQVAMQDGVLVGTPQGQPLKFS